MSNDGVCYIASKTYYFGVGGSTSTFIKTIDNESNIYLCINLWIFIFNMKGSLNVSVTEKIEDGISTQREILQITFKNNSWM